MTITAPTSHINHRGDTLGGVNLTIEISAPMPEVLRIQTSHYRGVVKKAPSFDLANMTDGNLKTEETGDAIICRSGNSSSRETAIHPEPVPMSKPKRICG